MRYGFHDLKVIHWDHNIDTPRLAIPIQTFFKYDIYNSDSPNSYGLSIRWVARGTEKQEGDLLSFIAEHDVIIEYSPSDDNYRMLKHEIFGTSYMRFDEEFKRRSSMRLPYSDVPDEIVYNILSYFQEEFR